MSKDGEGKRERERGREERGRKGEKKRYREAELVIPKGRIVCGRNILLNKLNFLL